MLKHILSVTVVILGFVISSVSVLRADTVPQIIVSATPVQVSLPSPLPLLTEAPAATEVSATRTPTLQGPAMLEAITEANVRSAPDPESERLGVIRTGDMFPIIGRYYRWYQFQYDQAPGGTAWVFDELVTIIGDEASIKNLAEDAAPTVDTLLSDSSATLAALTQTPGGVLTATALSLNIPLPGQGGAVPSEATDAPSQPASILPTFTYPPNLPNYNAASITDSDVTLTPNPEAVTGSNSSSFPPVVPVLLLTGAGLVGFFLSSIWRKK
jgi:hypothetical protein